jgi:uncharacterized protein (DUF1501 family)
VKETIMNLRTTRRGFLQRGSALSLAGLAAPWGLNLAAIGNAAASVEDEYKALVCVFLSGGNDNFNTLVPFDQANYDIYRAVRPTLGLDKVRDGLEPLEPLVALPGDRQYALSPRLPKLRKLFHADLETGRTGKLAILLNVGTLRQPITDKAQLLDPLCIPPRLYSHNDQRSVWQSSKPEGATEGWGGRFADDSGIDAGNPYTCINVSSNASFLTGITASQYQVTPTGAVELAAGSQLFDSPECSAALRELITQAGPSAHPLEKLHADLMARALSAGTKLNADLLANAHSFATAPPETDLAAQLHLVARIMSISHELGTRRQIFMVNLGGFDTHNSLDEIHPALLTELDDAMDWFYKATEELALQDRVTTFTASDFGRSLAVNVDGSDHGWGGVQFVLGGSVKGQQYFGSAPEILFEGGQISGAEDAGAGRLIPRTSVDEYAATLGHWLGVPDPALNGIFPNLHKFSASLPPYLDFYGEGAPSGQRTRVR